MPANCCVAGCNNRQRNSKLPFYNIPRGRTPFERNRRQLWLKAIPRDKWSSKTLANARICGAHFVSGKRSDDITAPNFVPTIFPAVTTDAVNSRGEEKKSREDATTNLDNEDGAKEELENEETDKGSRDGDADGNKNDGEPERVVESEKPNEACQHAGCNLAAEVRSDLRRKFRRKSHDEQSNYLVSCMRLRDSKFTYGVRVGDEILPACLSALGDTFGQSLTRLKLLREKLTRGVSVAAIRGRRRNGRKEKRCPVKVQAREHVGSFPLYESHFGRGVYLNPILSTRTMHSLYARKFPPMTIKYYRNVFGSEFELGFGQPRSDSCRACDELFAELQAARTDEEMSEVAVRSVVHHYREDETYRVVAEDVETAKRDPDVMVVCGDLQQALLAPQLTQCPGEFYRRQLSCYNYCVHDGASGRATMMLWDETVAKRGTAEIASCLLKYVSSSSASSNSNSQRRLVFWCDCRVGGHGGNWRLARALAHLLREGPFASAEVKFLRTGHSFLPCDRDFALIEKRRRVSPVAVPADWAQVIGSDGRNKRLEVVTMQRPDFKDFGDVEGFLEEPGAARIDCAAWIRLTADEPAVVRVRETHGAAEPWKCFAVVEDDGAKGRALPEAYSGALGIDKDKLSDLLDMCEYLTPKQAEFYRSLKAVEDDEDRG